MPTQSFSKTNQLSKKQYLGYGLIGIVAPLAFTASLATTAVLNPALLAYMGIIMLIIIGIIAAFSLLFTPLGEKNTFLLGCMCGAACSGGRGNEVLAMIGVMILAIIVIIALGITLGILAAGVAGIVYGIKKLCENEKMKGGVLISSSLALLTLFIAPLVISLINPNIKQFIWPSKEKSFFENFNMSKIAEQIDPKTKAILITCIVVTLVLSVIGFIVCAAKFGLFEEKSNETEIENEVIRKNTNNEFSKNPLYQPTTTTTGIYEVAPPPYSTLIPGDQQQTNNDENEELTNLANVNVNNIIYDGQHSNKQRSLSCSSS